MSDEYDVIVIGSGAGGGTLVHELAPTGRRILLLERGDFLRRELANWDVEEVFVKGRYVSKDSWIGPDGQPFQPQSHYFVGGATKLYGAALYRLRPKDFEAFHHTDGLSPSWPLDYHDFEPWYTKAEDLYQVHGNRGEDPTEGPWSKPYPWPAVSHEPRIQQIHDDMRAAGYGAFHAPSGLLLDEANPNRSDCIRCEWFDGFPCMVHAKSDAEVIAVRPALEHDNVTLMVNTMVTKLVTDAAGKSVTEVVADQDGEEVRFTAKIVVVSAGAANSAALLLRSASDTHPNGLANGSDQVGRNYMYHNSQGVLAIGKEPNPTKFQKTLGLNDFYWGAPDFDFPVGNIQMIGKSQGPMFRGDGPKITKLAPGWSLEMVAKHAVDFWLTTEDLPMAGNRVTLSSDGGINLAYTPTNQTETARLYHELEKVLNQIGFAQHHPLSKSIFARQDIPLAATAHQSGTVRFGADPATSVLNSDCRAHEVDNLYVVDTSFMCSIGAVNPSLTAIANAIRVADHLDQRLG